MRRVLLALLCALAAGCGSESGGNGDDDDDDGSTPPVMPALIDVATTDANVTLPFGVAVTGTGSDLVGSISVLDNTGRISLDGDTVAVAFYEKQPWPEFGYTLYQGIAVGASRWDVIWLYCQGTDLAYVWHEGVGGASIDYVNATGSCADTNASTLTQVALPALTLTTPAPVTGFTIDGGPLVALADGDDGLLADAAGTRLPFVPFEVVDCTACGGDGWYELHSIAWDEDLARAVFVILYLDFAAPDRVLATYARSIPDFGDPIGTLSIDATWTTPLSGGGVHGLSDHEGLQQGWRRDRAPGDSRDLHRGRREVHPVRVPERDGHAARHEIPARRRRMTNHLEIVAE